MAVELNILVGQILYELKVIGIGFLAILSIVGIINSISKLVDIVTGLLFKKEKENGKGIMG